MKTSAAFSNPEVHNETGSFFNPSKIFYGTCIPEFILEDDRLTSTEKLTYAVLAKFAEKDGNCCPSYQEIAERIQKNKRHTVRVINSLAEKGVIVRSISEDVINYYFVFHPSLFGKVDAPTDEALNTPDADKPVVEARSNVGNIKISRDDAHANDDLRKIPDIFNTDTIADDMDNVDADSAEKKLQIPASPVKNKAVSAKKPRDSVKKKRRDSVKKSSSSGNDESVSAKLAGKEEYIPDVEKKPEGLFSLPVNDESVYAKPAEKKSKNPPLPSPDDNSSSARRRRRRAAAEEDPGNYKSAEKKMRQRELQDAVKELEKLSSPAEEIELLPTSAPEYQSPSIDLSELPEAVIQLNDLCYEIDDINRGKRKFNPYQFVQHALQQNSHAEAIAYTLRGLIVFWHEDDTLAGDDIWKMGLSLLVSCRRHHRRYDEERDRETKDSWNNLMKIPHIFEELVSKSGK